MKILYIVSTLANSGPTNQLYNIVTNLNRDIYEPSILTLSPERTDTQILDFLNAGITVESLNLSRVKGIYRAPLDLKEKLKQINPSVVHTQGIRADTLSAKHIKNYNKVCTLRNYPYEDYLMKFGWIKGNIMAKQHMKSIEKIGQAVACSQSLAEIFKSNHNLSLNYIQNGVNTNLYTKSSEEEKIFYRKKLNLPLNKKLFISVGALIKRKDPLTIINAFNNINNKEDIGLIIVGDGVLKQQCKETSGANKEIYFTGQIDHVDEYLKAADYFISSSLSEGLPNTVLEALSVGLPCLLSNINQHKEILNLREDAGVLVEKGDIEGFTKAIKKMKNQNYDKLSDSARSIIDSHLSAEIMSKKYQDLYQQLVK